MANDYKYIGKNYTTPDLVAKVTGKAKYAEDYRAEGMLFIKLLLSPMPHARVLNVDASAALALPGVKGILRASDFPPTTPPKPIPTENPSKVHRVPCVKLIFLIQPDRKSTPPFVIIITVAGKDSSLSTPSTIAHPSLP